MSPSPAAGDAPRWQLRLAFANRRDELTRVIAEVEAFAEEHRLSARDRFVLNLVVDELATNLLEHSAAPAGQRAIELRARVHAGRLELELEDDGAAFDPLTIPPPTADQPVRERPIGGLGIHLVRQTVDDIRYQRRGDRNCVSVVCRLEPAAAG
ncbi:MAG TPA: ATP-binding protein [Thermoanaerobaculia bacterium]|nr:ATP-binding protein [Thermoanaerobaculia bacterium]